MGVSATETIATSPMLARGADSNTVPALRIAPETTAPPSTLEQPSLSVVIVNYCQWHNTAQLTHQLQTARCSDDGRAEVIIIDNHSPMSPLLDRLRRTDGVSLRRFSRNRGFARAVNEGCRLAQGEWVLLMNPDMTAPPGFLDQVMEVVRKIERQDAAECRSHDRVPLAKQGAFFPEGGWGRHGPRERVQEPRAGVVGFRLHHGDGSPQASCGRFPTLFSTVTGILRPRRRRRCRHLHTHTRQEVPWVTGCCLLVRRECFNELDGFDENFFLYYEDVDFCRRARESGWSVWFEPGVEVIHHSPLHTRQVPAGLRLITRHALLTYSARHWSGWKAWLLAKIISTEARLRQVWERWRGRPHTGEVYRELRHLVADFRRGRDKQVRKRLRRAAAQLDVVAQAADGQAGS